MPQELSADRLAPFVRMALDGVIREYPNHISHLLRSDEDLRPPRELTPAFYGCFDWHSAVHGHWVLARALRLFPEAPFAEGCRGTLARHLSAERLAREATYLQSRPAFERPYGLAWLLLLDAELAATSTDAARQQREYLAAAADAARRHLIGWLGKLTHPIRSGTHNQTAFAMGLALDAAARIGDHATQSVLTSACKRFHLADQDLPLHLEPSGEDFLSGSLGVADLMARVLPSAELSEWLARALPGIPRDGTESWLPVAAAADRGDGRLAHLDGLCLSRAWMLRRLRLALPADDARRPALALAEEAHRDAGLAATSAPNYELTHWIGTFAVYLFTEA